MSLSPSHILTFFCLSLAFSCAPAAQAQPQYTVTDLGLLDGFGNTVSGINNAGRVTGYGNPPSASTVAGFRTAANGSIDWTVNSVGTLGGTNAFALGLNTAGQTVGYSQTPGDAAQHGFRTAANTAVNPATDDLGTLGGTYSAAFGINTSGQVVGYAFVPGDTAIHAFRTAANSAINPATDDLGTLPGGVVSIATGINDAGRVVGYAYFSDNTSHAFRTSANSAINPATDDLGTFGGFYSNAAAINTAGQVVGDADTAAGDFHAFRTAADAVGPLVAANDLGTLGGASSSARAINSAGHAVGFSNTSLDPNLNVDHAFVAIGSTMYDLNSTIPANSGWQLTRAMGINDSEQITGLGVFNNAIHAYRLDPVATFNALIQPPINSDGSSVFSSSRGVVQVKFNLTLNGAPTCQLPPATIAVTRISSGTPTTVNSSVFVQPADNAANFRVAGCQYVYNLGAAALGAGTYRVDILITSNNTTAVAGSGVFALR